MNLRHIWVLFTKDITHGARNVIFIMAIALPVVFSLVMTVLFGTIFSSKPKLGVADVGSSQLAVSLLASDFMEVYAYPSEAELRTAIETGAVAAGVMIPDDFDASLAAGNIDGLTVLVWGQSLIQDRVIISSAIADTIVELSGRDTPITVNTELVGDRESLSWQQRLLPLVVLMSVIVGAVMVPSTSLVEEKEGRTLTALTTTPMTMAEVFFTKGFIGVLLSIFSGFMILSLNGGWGPNPLLLIVVLIMGGTLASAFGVLLGSRTKDVQTLFAVIKGIGILLYAPGFIALFPDTIPQWLAYIFPTYYIMQPVIDISQFGASLVDVLPHLAVLAVLTIALILFLGSNAKRLQVQLA
ncbi:MAG: ABC transporter permease [Anaerolineae bacterium]|nr:ABC transporter permease [Anaerolineae bacterium]